LQKDLQDSMIERTNTIKTGSGTLRQKMTLPTPAPGWKPEQHFPLVWSIARKYSRENNSEDSDAFAEGLLAMTKAVESYDPEKPASLTTWIRNCVNWALLDWAKLRKSKAFSCVESPELIADDHREKADYDSIEKLRGSVDLFDGRLRAILVGRLDGLTFAEIGDELGCSKQAAEQLFHRRVLPVLQARFVA
jgi:RNA polymerase sigma factor (sigma-70 family)